MKKRIAAAALAAVLVCGIIGLRPKAVGLAYAGVALGVLAFNLLGVMSGQYDDVAEGIGCFVESGVEGWQKAFVGSENTPSWFVSGWQQIYDTCASWFDSGEITISADGKVDLTYDQFLVLYGQIIGISSDTVVDFKSKYDYQFLSADITKPIAFDSLPLNDVYAKTVIGQSFAPVYFNDDICIFGAGYLYVHITQGEYLCSVRYLPNLDRSTFYNVVGISCSTSVTSFADYLTQHQIYGIVSLNRVYGSYISSGVQTDKDQELTSCYVFRNGKLTVQAISDLDIDLSSLNSGLVTSTGDYYNFVHGITSCSSSEVIPGLDDLSDVLPLDKTKNPTLEVDTDPSIVNPDDAITVKDVPGNPDMTLTEYKAQLKLDIDIPSIISTKFPFCIPYDLIRILGVFVADPVAPVFRIPISTDPSQLEPFKGNQTIGNIPEDFEPMFEIDEELVIDLSVVPLVQPICYTVFIVGFIVLLIHITPKMINH